MERTNIGHQFDILRGRWSGQNPARGSESDHGVCPLADDFHLRPALDPASPKRTYAEILAERDVHLLPPGQIEATLLAQALRELISQLAACRVFVCTTDHLSDRDLYERLFELLRDEPLPFPSDGKGQVFSIDLVQTGRHDDLETWLRYYATEKERSHWLNEFPSYPMPPMEQTPYDRDRFMPTCPEGIGM
jgi:hypothetical protein